MDIEEALENAVRDHLKRNGYLPLTPRIFPKIKADVHAYAISIKMDPEVVKNTINDVVNSWQQQGLCIVYDTINGDINLTDEGYKYFS